MSTVPPETPPYPPALPPLPPLLHALQGLPHVGWVLKESPALAYVQWSGALPMADPRLSRMADRAGVPAGLASPGNSDVASLDEGRATQALTLRAGQTDADHFDPTQASILRLADLRALRQAVASAELHRIETLGVEDVQPAMDWRAWRTVLPAPAQSIAGRQEATASYAEPGPQPVAQWLLVVWVDMGFTERSDQLLAHAQRQIQAQQLLIAQLRAQLPADSGLSGSQTSLAWAAERFAQQLKREVDLSRREQRSFALLLLQMGRHDAPCSTSEQAVAGLLAQSLAAGTRAMDTVAQIGERRFAVLLSGAQLTPAYARAEALRRQAAAQVAMEAGEARRVELFVGVAAYPLTAELPDALEEAAQQALHEALAQETGCSVLARVSFGTPPQ